MEELEQRQMDRLVGGSVHRAAERRKKEQKNRYKDRVGLGKAVVEKGHQQPRVSPKGGV